MYHNLVQFFLQNLKEGFFMNDSLKSKKLDQYEDERCLIRHGELIHTLSEIERIKTKVIASLDSANSYAEIYLMHCESIKQDLDELESLLDMEASHLSTLRDLHDELLSKTQQKNQ